MNNPTTIALDNPIVLRVQARGLGANDTNRMELNPFIQFCGMAGNPQQDYSKWGGMHVSNMGEYRRFKRLRTILGTSVGDDSPGLSRVQQPKRAHLNVSSGRARSVGGIRIDAAYKEARLAIPDWIALMDDLHENVAASQFGVMAAHAFGRIGSEPAAFAQDFEVNGAFSGTGDFEPDGTTDEGALKGKFITQVANGFGIEGGDQKVQSHPMVWGAWDLPEAGTDPRGNLERGDEPHHSDAADAQNNVAGMMTFDKWVDVHDATAKMRNPAGRGGISFNPMMLPNGVKDAEGQEISGEGYCWLTHREAISVQIKADAKWKEVQHSLMQGGKKAGLLTGYYGAAYGQNLIVGYDKVPVYKNANGVRIARGLLLGRNGMSIFYTDTKIPKRFNAGMNRSLMAVREALLPVKMRHWNDADNDACAIGWEYLMGCKMHDWIHPDYPDERMREGTVALDSVIPTRSVLA